MRGLQETKSASSVSSNGSCPCGPTHTGIDMKKGGRSPLVVLHLFRAWPAYLPKGFGRGVLSEDGGRIGSVKFG